MAALCGGTAGRAEIPTPDGWRRVNCGHNYVTGRKQSFTGCKLSGEIYRFAGHTPVRALALLVMRFGSFGLAQSAESLSVSAQINWPNFRFWEEYRTALLQQKFCPQRRWKLASCQIWRLLFISRACWCCVSRGHFASAYQFGMVLRVESVYLRDFIVWGGEVLYTVTFCRRCSPQCFAARALAGYLCCTNTW